MNSKNPGMVDIGWKGNTNRVLNYILRREENTFSYLSFFLGVKETRHMISSIGDYEAGIILRITSGNRNTHTIYLRWYMCWRIISQPLMILRY